MSLSAWEMPREVYRRVLIGNCIRDIPPEELLGTVEIKVTDSRFLLLGRRCVAVNKGTLLVSSRKFADLNKKQQASIIYHELVHIAQQQSMGWLRFKMKYMWQWICADFSYKKMKKMGLEKEATNMQDLFSRRVNGSSVILL